MKDLSDEQLKDIYIKALLYNLDAHFIDLLKAELEKRKIIHNNN